MTWGGEDDEARDGKTKMARKHERRSREVTDQGCRDSGFMRDVARGPAPAGPQGGMRMQHNIIIAFLYHKNSDMGEPHISTAVCLQQQL
nr:hypothetical protein CFP56_30826 [Quercus suber]